MQQQQNMPLHICCQTANYGVKTQRMFNKQYHLHYRKSSMCMQTKHNWNTCLVEALGLYGAVEASRLHPWQIARGNKFHSWSTVEHTYYSLSIYKTGIKAETMCRYRKYSPWLPEERNYFLVSKVVCLLQFCLHRVS